MIYLNKELEIRREHEADSTAKWRSGASNDVGSGCSAHATNLGAPEGRRRRTNARNKSGIRRTAEAPPVKPVPDQNPLVGIQTTLDSLRKCPLKHPPPGASPPLA
ncbi:hypothetical protein RF11_05347 [Thelohanellus kitauei]|uniref:Uncharacterized protein n=1 Tax=Thelohanellus kitauei TaxID=669202 RepID=A0A0C2N1L9_THEKT|nr:hypothetical protein RF11_05347 [Thelohanellus kitauei]